MAKGLRSSVKKTNRSKLKSNVFGPIEDERAARLSAKLMELASQPRSSNTEMEIDTGAGRTSQSGLNLSNANSLKDSKKDGDPDLEPSDQREGALLCFSSEIPSSLLGLEEGARLQCSNSRATVAKHGYSDSDDEDAFYTMLGCLGDLVGFDDGGFLLFDCNI